MMRCLIVSVSLLLLATSAYSSGRMDVAPDGVATPTPSFAATNRVLSVGLDYVEIEVDCYHGGGCACCGRADYACNTSNSPYPMPSYCPFVDPLPSRKTVVKIKSHVWGVACNLTGNVPCDFDVLVNGHSTGVGVLPGDCTCGGCYEGIGAATPYSQGFPGYVYGGENRLAFDRIDDGICVDRVVLTIYFRDRRPREVTMPDQNP